MQFIECHFYFGFSYSASNDTTNSTIRKFRGCVVVVEVRFGSGDRINTAVLLDLSFVDGGRSLVVYHNQGATSRTSGTPYVFPLLRRRGTYIPRTDRRFDFAATFASSASIYTSTPNPSYGTNFALIRRSCDARCTAHSCDSLTFHTTGRWPANVAHLCSIHDC